MFIDHIKITVKAGDGGNGCASFRREKYVPKGGPDGGDGGRGGDVILEVDPHTDSLRFFYYKPKHSAPNGKQGSSAKRTGRSGQELVLKVPPGTVVFSSNEEGEKSAASIADLTQNGERFILAKGGEAGLGNVRFKSSTNQAPSEGTPGEPGEEGEFFLELRRIADAGFVGFPNAGKSTLLTKISSAHPKIASYPFTTLTPHIGVMELGGYQKIHIADIPGIIEGAHQNRGLGHAFLRHITRCSLLLFVLDMDGTDGRTPWDDLMSLRKEIKLYSEELAQYPWWIIANKMDLPTAEENLKIIQQKFSRVPILPLSAETEDGLDLLKKELGGFFD